MLLISIKFINTSRTVYLVNFSTDVDNLTTSIKISDKSKKILDRLQAKITLLKDEKITLQEILDNILELMEENEDLLLKKLEKLSFPLEKKEIDNLINFSWDFGVRTSEQEIDKILYGE